MLSKFVVPFFVISFVTVLTGGGGAVTDCCIKSRIKLSTAYEDMTSAESDTK